MPDVIHKARPNPRENEWKRRQWPLDGRKPHASIPHRGRDLPRDFPPVDAGTCSILQAAGFMV